MRAVAPGSQDAGRRAHTEKQSHVKRDASCRKPEHREWQKRASGEREAGNAEWPEEGRGGKPPGRGRAVCLREVMTLTAGKVAAAGLLWELGGRSSGHQAQESGCVCRRGGVGLREVKVWQEGLGKRGRKLRQGLEGSL